MSYSSGDGGRSFPLSPALRQALISADAKHRASLEVLRMAICEYIEDLQDQGVHARDAVTAIRGRVADLRSSGDAGTVGRGGLKMDGLVDEMIASCLEVAD